MDKRIVGLVTRDQIQMSNRREWSLTNEICLQHVIRRDAVNEIPEQRVLIRPAIETAVVLPRLVAYGHLSHADLELRENSFREFLRNTTLGYRIRVPKSFRRKRSGGSTGSGGTICLFAAQS